MIVNHIFMNKKLVSDKKRLWHLNDIFTVAATQQKAKQLVWEVFQSVTILTSFTKWGAFNNNDNIQFRFLFLIFNRNWKWTSQFGIDSCSGL